MRQKYELNLMYLQGTVFVRVCQTRYRHDPLNETSAMEASYVRGGVMSSLRFNAIDATNTLNVPSY